MKILVTGGAGYIGSHMVLKLLEAGHQPVVLDDLSTGLQSFVGQDVAFHQFNLGNMEKLQCLFEIERFDAVMHFAASIEVGESIHSPAKYYKNNFVNTLTLLEVMKHFGVKRLVFSSTAAIFGDLQRQKAQERHPKNPVNPYGISKLMCEQLLQDFDLAHGLKAVCLRYFNAAGADPLSRVGYRRKDLSHLIPIVLQAASGEREHLEIYGRDYPTADGTCVRDYIHVMDLCEAHLLALNHLAASGESRQYNLGNGQGYSVQEVIEVARKITAKEIRVIDGMRRAGDPAQLVADSELIRQELGWKPLYPALETIVQHAWQWEQKCKQVAATAQPLTTALA